MLIGSFSHDFFLIKKNEVLAISDQLVTLDCKASVKDLNSMIIYSINLLRNGDICLKMSIIRVNFISWGECQFVIVYMNRHSR